MNLECSLLKTLEVLRACAKANREAPTAAALGEMLDAKEKTAAAWLRRLVSDKRVMRRIATMQYGIPTKGDEVIWTAPRVANAGANQGLPKTSGQRPEIAEFGGTDIATMTDLRGWPTQAAWAKIDAVYGNLWYGNGGGEREIPG